MATNGNDHNDRPTVLVVVQLGGGNDFMNTVVPYTDPLYYDLRTSVNVPEDEVLRIDDHYGFHPAMGPVKEMWDAGNMAIVPGVGYPNPNRSHFRSMDIWHTCEPDKVATEGWLGRAIRDMDPRKENVLTGVNFGNGLPRALVTPGVPVTSVAQIESYGLLTSMEAGAQRSTALELFQKVYGQAIGTGPVMDYIRQTGIDALKGAEILKQAPAKYSSSVEYADNAISQSLKGAAQVHLADLGARVLYTQQGGYDVHSNEMPTQQQLWTDLSGGLSDFFADLREHDASENVIALDIHGVWAARPGQRQRHRPRLRRRRVPDRRQGDGRNVRRVPVSGSRQAARRRPPVQLRLPRHVLQYSWSSGLAWTQSR